MEPLDHRERRLMQLGEALEKHLDEDWIYFLVIGRPGDPDPTNIISNVPPGGSISEITKLLNEIARRYQAGERPKEL